MDPMPITNLIPFWSHPTVQMFVSKLKFNVARDKLPSVYPRYENILKRAHIDLIKPNLLTYTRT